MSKKKTKLQSYIVRGTIEFRGDFFVDAYSPEDAQERVDAGKGEFDMSNAETINWEALDEGELNE